MQKRFYRVLCLCFISYPLAQGFAVNYTWNITTGGDWSVAGNWTPAGGPPDSGADSVEFLSAITGPATITLINPPTSPLAFSFTFNSAQSYTIGTSANPGPLQIIGGINAFIDVVSGTHTIAADVKIGSGAPSGSAFVVLSGAGVLNISGNISDIANPVIPGVSINMPGGTLNLTGTNTYTGGTSIFAGTLSGNTLGLQGIIDVTGSSAIVNFAQASSGTFTGSCTGTVGSLQVNASGQTITFTGNNSGFSGTTAIGSSTTLNVGAANSLPTGTVTMASDSILQAGVVFSSADSIALLGASTFDAKSFQMTLSGPITGSSPLTLQGTGASSITFSGNNSLFSGQTNISGTTLIIGAANNVGTGLINMTSGTVQIGSSPLTFTLSPNFTLNAANTFNLNGASNTITLSGNIGGSGSFTVLGGGTLILSGTNSYNGGTTVNSSTLTGNTTSLYGAINLTGTSPVPTLNFNQTTTGTYSGNLSSTGSAATVNVSSPGQIITFTGTNSGFIGTTNIQGTTTLNIGGAAALPPGPLTMAAGSTLQAGVSFSSSSASAITLTGSDTFDSQSFTMTLSRPITGSGSFTKIGTGTVILAGINNYSGTTTVSAGTLQGNASLPSLQGNISIAGGASLVFNETSTGTYSGNLSGAGSLVVQGGSTLIMNGNNNPSFTGPTTMNSSTTLQLASSTALGTGTVTLSTGILQSGTANLLLPNTITVTGTSNTIDTNGNSMTLSGVIQGSGGGFTKTGAGTLFVTGTSNTYSGGTIVNQGTLQGSSSTLQGAFTITSPGQLTFNQTTIGTSAIPISGNGNLTVQGGSTLTMTGNSSTFTGTAQVINSSTLIMNGNLQGGAVTVAAGSVLGGSGTIGGGSTILGQLAPGVGGSGTLSVNGALTFSGTPSFLVTFTPTTSGSVVATGLATLAGNVIATPNIGSSFFGASKTYTILTASSLAGTFNPSVISTSPLFTGSLSYTPTNVLLTILASQPFLSFPFANANERAVGNNIDAIGLAGTILPDMTAVIDALAGQSIAEVNKALDQMHPAALSAFAEIQAELGGQLLSLFHRAPTLICACNRPNRIWAQPFGDWLKVKDRGIEIGFWTKTRGVAFGYDRQFFDCWTVGVGGAWNSSTVKWFIDRGYAYVSGLYGSLYTDLLLGDFYFGSSIYAGKDWYSTVRHIRFTTVDRQARSMSSGVDVAGQVTGAYFFGTPACLLYPYATLDCLYLQNGSFSERGANSLNLHVDEYTSTTLRLETGAAFQWSDKNAAGTFCISPLVAMGYVWEKPYRDHYESTFKGQTISFKTLGWHEAWNLFNLRFGLKLTYRCIYLDSQYIGDAAMDDHAFLLNQRANFRLGINF